MNRVIRITVPLAALIATSAISETSQAQQRQGVIVREHGSVNAVPTAPPPAARVERHGARPGFVWISGRWDWRNGRWGWTAGHWERQQRGRRWTEGRWERQGDRYVWVDGRWLEAPMYPTEAPPPPREERVAPRRGFSWASGRWDWNDGNWHWTAGHWEREQRGR